MTGKPFQQWYSNIEQAVNQKIVLADYQALSKSELHERLRRELAQQRGDFPVATLLPTMQQLIGAKTPVVMFSEYDAIKQVVSRQGQTFSAAVYIVKALNNHHKQAKTF